MSPLVDHEQWRKLTRPGENGLGSTTTWPEGVPMNEHPNVARIVEGYERYAARDVDGVLRLLSDDVVWHVTGGRFAGDHKGRDEVVAHFEALTRFTEGTLLLNVLDVFADGRATEFWNVHGDPEAYEAFFV